MMSNELDILVVGYNDERFTTEIRQAFRHWQVYSCGAPHALYGRRFRRAYFTDGVLLHQHGRGILTFLRGVNGADAVAHLDYYSPDYTAFTEQQSEDLRVLRRARHSE